MIVTIRFTIKQKFKFDTNSGGYYKNMNQDLINQIKHEMYTSDEDVNREYYGSMQSYYENIDKYLDRIPDVYDKIYIAQYANNFEKANELISSLDLSDEIRRKYERLLQDNADLNETIDIRILSSKYNFLDDILDMIVTDKRVQEQLLSLSDEKLELFKMLYQRLEENVDYNIPYITTILNKMGRTTPYTAWRNTPYYRYEELENSIIEGLENGKELSTEEIDNLLYLYTSNLKWDINNLEELSDFPNIFQSSVDAFMEKAQSEEPKDLDNIKLALLLKTYGINVKTATNICKKYNIKGIPITQENVDLFEMYKAMLDIIGEDNPDVLIDTYNQFSSQMSPHPNFMRTITFENSMRKVFAQTLNSSVYKCTDSYTINDGVKIFDAGTDFKMIVTAIGAYQGDFPDQENYFDYWNSPTIRSHGNCCSLIGNNNLSMATPKNIILGFSTMDDNMLLLSGCKDLNSTTSSRNFNIASEESFGTNPDDPYIEFSNPDILIDNTRGDYNELVYERRDLSSNPLFYKKNPDYIVFIEEYENIDDYFEEYKDNPDALAYLNEQKKSQEHQLEQSLKAAKDFNIPIVRINRETCAKQAIFEIEQLLSEFENTLNPEYLERMICQFENNRVGNHDKHLIIRSKYFSTTQMSTYLNRLEKTISNIEDTNLRNTLLNKYKKAIVREQEKIKKAGITRKSGQTSGIDFESTLARIEEMAVEPSTVSK